MSIQLWFNAGLGALVALLAVPLMLRRVPPNALYGLRVPATFRDDGVWYDANAATGRDLLALGVAMIVTAFVIPTLGMSDMTEAIVWTCIIAIGAIVVVSIGWHRANRMFRERHPTP